jgi:hypothetical protein
VARPSFHNVTTDKLLVEWIERQALAAAAGREHG